MYELQSHRVFSPLDEMLPPFYYAYLLTFPTTEQVKQGTIRKLLQDSLSALLVEYPYLTGNVRRDNSDKEFRLGHLVLDIPEPFQDTKVVFNDLTAPGSGFEKTYQQLAAAQMPLQNLDAHFFAPLTAGIGETRKVFSMQANFVAGGLILAACFHHNFCDAYGAARIVARFSEHCNGSARAQGPTDGSTGSGMPELFNRDAITAKYDHNRLKNDPNLWQLNCLDHRDPPKDYVPFEWPIFLPSLLPPQDPPVNSFMFSFTSQTLAELKAYARPDKGDSWVSTNDALAAFLWRHTIRARYPWSAQEEPEQHGNKEAISNVIVALDGRKTLSISPSYVGNVIFHCYTPLPLNSVGSKHTPLSLLALAIRQKINRTRDRQLLTDVVAFASTLPDVRTIRYANDNLGKDLYTTSWIDLDFYRLDWGLLGKAQFFRIPDKQFYSLSCILPPRQGDGVVDVIMSLTEPDGLRLLEDEEFKRFATYVPPV
ncbi:MAG: hypothetical protein Q9191_003871 [Dirinaria sp. TL-2023a]